MSEQRSQPAELTFVEKVIRNARIIARTSMNTYRLSRKACLDGANQKWVELTSLAYLIRRTKPKWAMEIGVYEGGTLGLFAQMMPANGTLIGLDLKLSGKIQDRIRARMKTGQILHLLEVDSHSIETKKQVMKILGENRLDFLFIDGDHSYKGVWQDFENYSSLLQPGGIVAFHDIVPNNSASVGSNSEAESLEVYKFWREIRLRYPHREFVEDRNQSNCGIGVLQF